MSQSQMGTASSGRIALAIGVVALIIGASALGYAVYLGLSQVPSQISALSVNVTPSDKTIRVEWTTAFESGQDRFYPNYVTVAQGDNLTIILITNDTGDAHTFTIGLGLRGLPSSALFQMNNSWIGLSSGDFLTPKNDNFTGKANGCTDNNGNPTTCNTQKADCVGVTGCTGPNGNCNNTASTPPPCDLWSTGYLGIVSVPGVYKFFCFFHQKGGMFGYLTVLPNKAFSG